MDKSKQKDIWLLARNALYELEQAEINSVREKLRKIMELTKDGSPRTL